MRPPTLSARDWLIAWSSLLLGATLVSTQAAEPVPSPLPLVTNLHQLRGLTAHDRRLVCALQLEGVICATNLAKDLVVLQDDSGAEILQLALRGQQVVPGQRVRLEAERCLALLKEIGIEIRLELVVDNDGIHAMRRRGGRVYLSAGAHPVRLDWFNGPQRYGLEVDYEGPGVLHQAVPDSALFRAEPELPTGATNLVSGLDYRAYEGDWGNLLPDFTQLRPIRTGTTTNFDITLRTREEHVGLEFTGFLAVPRDGIYSFETESDDGTLLFVENSAPCLIVPNSGAIPLPRRLVPGQVPGAQEEGFWAELQGTVQFVSESGCGAELELRFGSERVRVKVADTSELFSTSLLHSRIRATGVCRKVFAVDGRMLAGELSVVSASEIVAVETGPERLASAPLAPGSGEAAAGAPTEAELPTVLTTVEQVKRLKREDAQRGYPARIRGVVTDAHPLNTGIVLQDATRGIFVRGASLGPQAPRLGEYWEIEGVTGPGDFAPVVNVQRSMRLGLGCMPEPLPATWDQLMNGSLDTQLVELRGIVTSVEGNRLELLLREGRINLALPDLAASTLTQYRHCLIRIRGCLFPAWDRSTHRVKVGQMSLSRPSINVDEPAPADPFSTPRKRAAELLLFDLGADAFQRVKVAGQVLAVHAEQYFMLDGTNGLRFTTKSAAGLEVGDLVEAVGFPELSGPSPVLREAVARAIGHAELPKPNKLVAANLLDKDHDATRVQVDGLLVNRRKERAEQVLEMQIGLRTVVARFNAADNFVRPLAVGSKLELTGIYAGLGGNRALGHDIDSCELLLNSPSDIRVLARPAWWTLPRFLTAFALGTLVLFAAMLWALSLRAQVGAQTQVIRQKAQREAALEERARIAQDIHDDLGSSLTRIMMLGERIQEEVGRPDELGLHARKIVTSARGAVQSLDEIVWAVNPENDTLDGLVGYLNQYANQFFEGSSIRYRLDMPAPLPSLLLPAEVRHDLFLAVKEALNNVLKHSQASEVRLHVTATAAAVAVAVEDNGRGFDPGKLEAGGENNGLANMRQRVERLGGEFALKTGPGQGTNLTLSVRMFPAHG